MKVSVAVQTFIKRACVMHLNDLWENFTGNCSNISFWMKKVSCFYIILVSSLNFYCWENQQLIIAWQFSCCIRGYYLALECSENLITMCVSYTVRLIATWTVFRVNLSRMRRCMCKTKWIFLLRNDERYLRCLRVLLNSAKLLWILRGSSTGRSLAPVPSLTCPIQGTHAGNAAPRT